MRRLRERRTCSALHRGILRDLVLIAALLLTDLRDELFFPGLAVFLSGAALHCWSKGVLRRNYEVTTGGPYRLVRHPFYLANGLIDISICIMAGVPALILAYVPIFLAVYIPVMRREERDLIAAHGEAYLRFRETTPRLLPYRLDRLSGPLDVEWSNIIREQELSRLLRILAIPFYPIMVDLVWQRPLWPAWWPWQFLACVMAAASLHIAATRVKRPDALGEQAWREILSE